MRRRRLHPAIGIGLILWPVLSLPTLAADWDFKETIVDETPLQPDRITDVEIVDINNDGRLDLWYSGSRIGPREHKAAWYERRGDTWVRHTPFPGPSLGGNWADVDGDGDMDLITGQDRNWARTGNHALVWMENPLNDGRDPANHAWAVHQIHPDPADPDELHTGFIDADGRLVRRLDLNRDGRLDIVIAAFKQTLWYLPGPADPKEGPWRFYRIAEHRAAHGGAAIADLDADGDLDIVWGHSWYENPGHPAAVPWRPHMIDPQWPNECKIAIGDLDLDGYLDVVLTGEETADGLAWYRNPGPAPRESWEKQPIIAGWKGLHSCQLADFDKDGDLDIFTAQMHKRPGQRVAILENDLRRSRRWETHILSDTGSHNAKVGDIDGDGDVDIAGKNYEGDYRPRVWTNPNHHALSLDHWKRHIVDANNPSRHTILVGDLNRDGRPDLVTGTVWYRNPGSPDETWGRAELGKGMGNALVIDDLDADGDLDILGEGLSWAANWGSSSFGIGTEVAGHPAFVQGATVLGRPVHTMPHGRFDTGGARHAPYPLQIAFTYKNGDAIRRLTVPSRPGRGAWDDVAVYDWTGKSKCVDAGDIDRDGDVDIAFVGRDGPTIQWLRNDGHGTYQPVDLAKSPAQINHRCCLADINGDGRLDLVVGHKGKLLTWFEQPADADAIWMKHVVADDHSLAFDPLSLDVADMDTDGDLDVIIGEHTPKAAQGSECSLVIFENADRTGRQWTRHTVHKGDEHHQGAQTVDIDHDGDLDLVSVGWTHNLVLLYENLARSTD